MARHEERIGSEPAGPVAGGRATYADDEPVVARVEDRRPRRRTGPIAILVLLVVIAVAAFLLIRRNSSTPDATRDVTVQSCTANGGGKPTASGQILNSTSKSSNYVVRLRFKDANGNAVSNGIAAVNGVGTNQTAHWQLTGVQAAKGPVTCELSGVTRTHIPGQ